MPMPRRPVAVRSRGSERRGPDDAALPDFSEPCALNTPPLQPTFVPAGARCDRRRAGGAAGAGHPAIKGGRHGQRRERLRRHKARGGLSRALPPHAGRLPRERGRARLPPLRQPCAVPQIGSGRVGGEAPGDHDGGGRQTERAMIGGAGARTACR